MQEQTRQQLQGAVDLLCDATQGAAGALGTAHEDIAAIPYAVLRRIPLLGGPASAVESAQQGITRLVYRSVSAIAGVAAAVATRLLQADSR